MHQFCSPGTKKSALTDEVMLAPNTGNLKRTVMTTHNNLNKRGGLSCYLYCTGMRSNNIGVHGYSSH